VGSAGGYTGNFTVVRPNQQRYEEAGVQVCWEYDYIQLSTSCGNHKRPYVMVRLQIEIRREKQMEKTIIDPGIYRHFKGNRYEVIGIAKHSETLEEMVVYKALYGDGGLWIRPVAMWEEFVEVSGKTVRRFEKELSFQAL
jgi:hypothetical protein